MTDEHTQPPEGRPLDRGVRRLVRCPLCGAEKGYVLGEGTTFRWWLVWCANCGREVGECRTHGSLQADGTMPETCPAADVVWDKAGAYAECLRMAIQRMAACESIYTARVIANVALHGLQDERPGLEAPHAGEPEDAQRLT
jgi:hypothetical protein